MRTRINAGFLDRAHARLSSIFYDRLIANRQRLVSRLRPRWLAAVPAKRSFALIGTSCSLLGLALSLVMPTHVILGITNKDLIVYFALSLPIIWIGHWSARRDSNPWPPYWRFLARIRANASLKRARAAAPFDAEYDFKGTTVVYFRIRANQAGVVWHRSLQGWSMEMDGFTLLFKKETAVAPYCIILHEPSAEFNTYLSNIGVRPIPPIAVQS
jgi:hypothetical protein